MTISEKDDQPNQSKATIIPKFAVNQPSWLRLEDQLRWYDGKSVDCQQKYKQLKIAQVALAALIPVMGLLPVDFARVLMALSGAVIALLEAVQHMNQYSSNWVAYRSTAERLKHEKFLFLSIAGPYRGVSEPDRLPLLAERVEELVSTEHALWVNEAKQTVSAMEKKGQKSEG